MSSSRSAVGSQALRACQEILSRHARTFSLAARLLPPAVRDDAAVVYAFCRTADDAVDGVMDPALARERLSRVSESLARVLRPGNDSDPVVQAFGVVVENRGVPASAAWELIDGMAMDLAPRPYRTIDALLLYCYRAAGTVGWMMAAVMGAVRRADLTSAIHLGMAMQLTNICRDVLEDWNRGRLYLPADWLAAEGCSDLFPRPGESFPDSAAPAVRATVERLLSLADRYYASGDEGLLALPWRCALAVRTARKLYAAIGGELARTGHDVRVGRVTVPAIRKLWLMGWAVLESLAELPARWARRHGRAEKGGQVDGRDLIRL
jgi:15-cis-phytoene synthase